MCLASFAATCIWIWRVGLLDFFQSQSSNIRCLSHWTGIHRGICQIIILSFYRRRDHTTCFRIGNTRISDNWDTKIFWVGNLNIWSRNINLKITVAGNNSAGNYWIACHDIFGKLSWSILKSMWINVLEGDCKKDLSVAFSGYCVCWHSFSIAVD